MNAFEIKTKHIHIHVESLFSYSEYCITYLNRHY